MLKATLPLTLLLISSLCSAEGISGIWQHPKDPVWIEVTATAGHGLAVRNDSDPSSIGFAVLKEVTALYQSFNREHNRFERSTLLTQLLSPFGLVPNLRIREF